MEFSSRRLLLLNKDVPYTTSVPPFPHTWPPQSSNPSQVSVRPVFATNVAYVFLVVFTTFFFVAFVFLYFHLFSDDAGSLSRRAPPQRGAAKSLPVVAHRGDAKQAECAICLEELGEGEAVKVMPHCKHVFHPQCIDAWLDAHATCPVCRCEAAERGEVGSVSEEEVVPNLN